MLFYERVIHPRPSIYLAHSPRSSEETVRPPELTNGHADPNASVNGSTWSVATLSSSGIASGSSSVASSYMESSAEMQVLRPRVVRRTTAGRSRSASLAPTERPAREAPPSLASTSKEASPSSSVTIKSLQNGDAHIAPVDKTDISEDKPHSSKSQSPDTSPSPSLSTSSEDSSTPIPNGDASARPPSPTPSLKAAQARIPAPQPLRTHISPNIMPDRTSVGLQA